jgi:hypothetical protein
VDPHPDPHGSALISGRLGAHSDPGGQKKPMEKEKSEKSIVLKSWMFSFEG